MIQLFLGYNNFIRILVLHPHTPGLRAARGIFLLVTELLITVLISDSIYPCNISASQSDSDRVIPAFSSLDLSPLTASIMW